MSAREDKQRRVIVQRLMWIAALGMGGLLVASGGYYWLTGGEYDFLLCVYMTIITVTTVGFSEVFPITGDPALELYTITVILLGMGAVLYFSSSLTAFLVSGQLMALFRQNRMKKELDKLEDHVIIAGVGTVGRHVVEEMVLSKRTCVVIDRAQDKLENALRDHDVPFIVGDASDEEVLRRAHIERARSIILSLSDDRENLFATITARTLNTDIRIIARGQDQRSRNKFKMAGADSVIYTNVIGGVRMASESIRPSATTFMDLMIQDRDHPRRIDELLLPPGSRWIGKTIRELNIRRVSDALIVAVHDTDNDEYHFNPGPSFELAANSTLVVLAQVEDLATLRAHLGT